MTDLLRPYIEAHLKAVSEARERACEQAIQTGDCGVLEIIHTNGDVDFQVTSDVPYGRIWVWYVP